jgi:hypothetical protein
VSLQNLITALLAVSTNTDGLYWRFHNIYNISIVGSVNYRVRGFFTDLVFLSTNNNGLYWGFHNIYNISIVG